MKKKGICENVFLTKFDTVGSSLDEFHKYEDEFCNLVNSHDTIIFAHSMGNYITGNMKCIGNVTHFISIAAPWEQNDVFLRSFLCAGYPLNVHGWLIHFLDNFVETGFHIGVCD
eukprot:UN02709